MIPRTLFSALLLLCLTACDGGDPVPGADAGPGDPGGSTGTLRVFASGGNEARDGIAGSYTADGWAVEIEHAILQVEEVRLRTMAGAEHPLSLEPVVVDLVPSSVEIFNIPRVPAQRWDAFSYHSRPVTEETVNLNVNQDLFDRMVAGGYSFYFAGTLIAPEDTRDADGELITEVPFELGKPISVDYERCVSGTDRTNGIVVPLNSEAQAEISWHLTHAFFDSFAEDAALRVEPFAALWPGDRPLHTDDLDVSLGSLRGVNGMSARDQFGNPLVYLPGMTGATTLREFFLNSRYGHFNGLEGFCMTTLVIHD